MIELNSPFSKRNLSVQQACTDKTFCMKLIDGQPKLKIKHNYFYQCQGFMTITETRKIDFLLYTNNLNMKTGSTRFYYV